MMYELRYEPEISRFSLLSADATTAEDPVPAGGGAPASTTPPADKPADAPAEATPPAETTPPADAKTNGEDRDWRAMVSDEKLRDHAGRFTSIDDLVKANLESRKKLSKAIVPPGTDASDEDKAAWNKALGVPESPDGYEFGRPEHLSEEDFKQEGVQANLKSFRDAMHAAGAPKGVAEAAVQAYWNMEAQARAAVVEEDKRFAEQQETALRNEWRGEEYDRNVAFANRAVADLFGQDLDAVRQIQTSSGRFVLDDARLVKAFAKIGREMSETSLGGVLTQAERETIDDQIADIRKRAQTALDEGDSKRANRFSEQERALIAKRDGNKTAVGSAGRVI